MSPTATLAAHLAGISAATVPAAVRDRAGLVLADTLGAIVAGQGDAAVRAMVRRHAMAGGHCRLPGTDARAAPPMAAFLNGFAGTALELDEGNYPAGGHPGIHAVAAALAEAEARDANGTLLLDAVIAGYEAGARVGMATRLRPAAHPHGTWGTLGAAAAVAKLRGHDAETTARALEVAASLGLATSATAALRGGSVRNAYAGMAAQTPPGLRPGRGRRPANPKGSGRGRCSAAWGRRRLRRPRDGGGLGRTLAQNRGLLQTGELLPRNAGSAEALELLAWPKRRSAPESVAAIEVETSPPAAALAEQAPAASSPAASSSLTVATRIVHGHA
jgi:hypothetical protein